MKSITYSPEKTSSPQPGGTPAVLLRQLKDTRGAGLALVLAVLIFTLYCYFTCEYRAFFPPSWKNTFFQLTGTVLLPGWKNTFFQLTGTVLLPGMLLTALLQAHLQFSYLWKRDCVDYYHSLPLSRTALFWGRYLAGLIWNVLPLLGGLSLMSLLLLGNAPEDALLWFFNRLFTLLTVIFAVYSLTVLVVISCNSPLLGYSTVFLILGAVVAVIVFLAYVGNATLFGRTSRGVYRILKELFWLESPTLLFFLISCSLFGGAGGLLLWCARTGFCHRPSEGPGELSRRMGLAACLAGALESGLLAGVLTFQRLWYQDFPWNLGFFLAATLLTAATGYIILFRFFFPHRPTMKKEWLLFLSIPLFLGGTLLVSATSTSTFPPKALVQTSGFLEFRSETLCDTRASLLDSDLYASVPITEETQGTLSQLASALEAYQKEAFLPNLLGRNVQGKQLFSVEWRGENLPRSSPTQIFFVAPQHEEESPAAQQMRVEIEALVRQLTCSEDYISGVFPITALDALTAITSRETQKTEGVPPLLELASLPQQNAFRVQLEAALREDFQNQRYLQSEPTDPQQLVLLYSPHIPFVAKGGTSAGKNAKGTTYTLDTDQEFCIPSTMTATNALLHQVLTQATPPNSQRLP